MVLASWIQESPVGWVSRKSCFLESKSQIGLLGFQRGLEAVDVQILVTNCSLICWPMSQPPWPLLPQRTRPGLESTSSEPTEMQRGGSRRSEDAARLSSVVAPQSPPHGNFHSCTVTPLSLKALFCPWPISAFPLWGRSRRLDSLL